MWLSAVTCLDTRLKNFKAQNGDINFDDKSMISILNQGTMDLIPNGRGGIHSSHVIYCPQLGIFVSNIYKLGKHVLFDECFVSIQNKITCEEVRGGFPSNGLYKLHDLASIIVNESDLWHYWFSHVHGDAFW